MAWLFSMIKSSSNSSSSSKRLIAGKRNNFLIIVSLPFKAAKKYTKLFQLPLI